MPPEPPLLTEDSGVTPWCDVPTKRINSALSNAVLSNPVIKFLQAQIGLDPESLGVRVLGDCLSDLARDFPDRSYAAIALSAQHDAEVFDQVVAHFSVNESWMFRNAEQFAQLRQFVQSRAQARPRPLNVLSLPCASGEEPASIAITLHEAGLLPGDFRIVAGDLDGDALAKARTGRFPVSAFRGAIPDSRWFERRDQHYILSPSLLARIEFRQLNVLDPGLFLDEVFDVIFCRNMLIYLHHAARNQVLQLLRRIAAPSALVFTGTAEPTIAKRDISLPNAVIVPAVVPITINAKRDISLPNAAILPSAVIIPSAVIPKTLFIPEPTPDAARWQSQLAGVEQSANDGDVQGACLRLDQLLDEAPTYAAAWYLRGVLASAQNDLAGAELALDRAAYLDPNHVPTLRLRAELARRSGDNEHADRIHARLKRRKGGP